MERRPQPLDPRASHADERAPDRAAAVNVQRARVLAPFALTALSVVAALTLGRVLESDRFVLPVLGAAVLPHALGALVRWRGWSRGLRVVLTVVGLGVYVVLVLEASTTTLGVPGSDTWHAIDQHLSDGWHLLRTAPAPAPTTDGAVLLGMLAVWCMAALADWLAFVRQTTLAATTPALVFFVWTSTLGTEATQLALTIGFCVAVGAFVLTQHLAIVDRRRTWLVSRHPARARWLTPAAILGGGAIVVALVVAPLVPGAGSEPVLDVTEAGRNNGDARSYRPAVTPFVDIGDKLDDQNDLELFTVEADRAEYWRVAALDTYSGDGGGRWTLSAEGDDSVSVGLPDTAPDGTMQQRFSIGPLGERWLPAAYRPVAITLPDTLVVRSSGTIVAAADEVAGLRYTVASRLAPLAGEITPAQQAATAAPVPARERPSLALPATAPEIDEIGRRARQIVDDAGAATPYEQAAALRDHFRDPANGFVYDTDVASADDGSAIIQFLDQGRGFCVQFASAYAVMARSLGIPARVAVGFTPGTRDNDGTFHVSSHDAHAWPEVYLSGLGWTHLFDPTPGRSGAAPGGSDLPDDTATGTAPVTTLPPPTTPTAPTPGTGTPATPGGAATPGTTPATPTLAPASTSSSSTGAWLPVLVTLAIVVALAGGYVVAVLAVKRRRRARRHADDPALAVSGAWAEALDRLHEAAFVPGASQTPLDIAGAVPAETGATTAVPLRELADAYSAVRYGGGGAEPEDARRAWSSLDELERALDEGVSWSRRWRRRLGPSTIVRR